MESTGTMSEAEHREPFAKSGGHKNDKTSRPPEQQEKITALRQRMHDHFHPLPPQLTNLSRLLPRREGAPEEQSIEHHYCVWFLASREWDVQRAFAMMQEVVAYRAAHHLDDTTNSLPSSVSTRGWEVDTVCTALRKKPRQRKNERIDRIVTDVSTTLSCGLHYWDKSGRPVCYVMIDSLDEPGVIQKLKANAKIGQEPADVLWEYVQHFLSVVEDLVVYQLMQQRAMQAERAAESSTGAAAATQGVLTLVMDMKGLHMGLLWKPMLELFRDVTRQLFQFYPDAVHRVIAINAPAIVRVAFKMVKGVMPVDFQKKISFVGSQHSLEALEEEIDRANIPAFLGGGCSCATAGGGGGGCCVDGYNRSDPRHRKGSDGEKTKKTHKARSTAAAAATGDGTDALSSNGADGGTEASRSDDVAGGEAVSTENISLSAGQRHRRVFALQPSEMVVWEFAVQNGGSDVAFTVYFIPDLQQSSSPSLGTEVNWQKVETKNLEHYQCHQSDEARQDDAFTAEEKGTLVLLWHNTRTWFKTRSVQLRVYKEDTSQQQREDEESVGAGARDRDAM